MQHSVDQIKKGIEQCKSKGEFLPVPHFDREDVHVKEVILAPFGSMLHRSKYKIDFDEGGWIEIEYTFKGKSRLFHTNSNHSIVKVTCSDPSLSFTEEWDDKV